MALTKQMIKKANEKRMYEKVKKDIIKHLRDGGVEERHIEMFESKTPEGEYLRIKVAQFFLDNGVSQRNVDEMFEYFMKE